MKSALVGLLALLALTLAVGTSRASDRRETVASQAIETRAALLEVEARLRSHDTCALTSSQCVARAQALAELHRYAQAGVFPHNHASATMAPIFVDEHGTLCAFADLLAFSGRLDFVKQVAATHNSAKVADLAQEPAVVSWSHDSGISIEEAATIQRPGYEPTPPEVAPVSTTTN